MQRVVVIGEHATLLKEAPPLEVPAFEVPEGPDRGNEATALDGDVATGRRAWPALLPVRYLIGLVAVACFVALWQASAQLGWVAAIFLPPPSAVISTLGGLLRSGDLWPSVLNSTLRVLAGFSLAALVAVPLGILMAVWWPAKAVLDPFISLLRPLPSITWIPLTMLWLGIGEQQKVAIVFMGSWIYVLLYTFESTRRVDPLLIRAARNLGAADFTVMTEVVLPGALPGILAGLKVTLAISWSCVLSAEMVAAQNGLGALIWQAKDWGNLALVLAGMLCISLVVLVADFLMARIERLLLPWERQQRH